MRPTDIDAVVEVARLSFPDHFEDRACFQNRLALYPRGCFVLADLFVSFGFDLADTLAGNIEFTTDFF